MPNTLIANKRKTAVYYDVEVCDWEARVNAAGSTVSTAAKDAVQKFVTNTKAAGLWSLLQEVGVFCGSNLTAALVKLKYVTAASLTNVNFVSGDYTEATGLMGNGTTKRLDTGFNLNTSLADASHLSFYLRDAMTGGGGNQAMMGGMTSGATDQFMLYASTPGSDITGRMGLTQSASAAGSSPAGFHLVSRQTLSDLRLYRNGVQVAQNLTTVTLTKAGVTVLLWAIQGASPSAFLNYHGSFYSIGAALTPAQAQTYYAWVQQLQADLSRAV
jgi:hypothetical protein